MRSIKQWCDYIVAWRIKKGFKTGWGNVPEKLLLIHSEISEAVEALRKMTIINGRPTHDNFYNNFAEELADTTIRIYDLSGSLKIDLEDQIKHKMLVNKTRSRKHGKNF